MAEGVTWNLGYGMDNDKRMYYDDGYHYPVVQPRVQFTVFPLSPSRPSIKRQSNNQRSSVPLNQIAVPSIVNLEVITWPCQKSPHAFYPPSISLPHPSSFPGLNFQLFVL